MLDNLFSYIDKLIKDMGEWHDKGFFYIIIIIAVGLLILLIVILLIIFLTEAKNDTPADKLEVINKAPSFCKEKGFDTWNWVNETLYTFTCINTTQKEDSIDGYFIS